MSIKSVVECQPQPNKVFGRRSSEIIYQRPRPEKLPYEWTHQMAVTFPKSMKCRPNKPAIRQRELRMADSGVSPTIITMIMTANASAKPNVFQIHKYIKTWSRQAFGHARSNRNHAHHALRVTHVVSLIPRRRHRKTVEMRDAPYRKSKQKRPVNHQQMFSSPDEIRFSLSLTCGSMGEFGRHECEMRFIRD